MADNDRLKRVLRNAERKDLLEQKLGISETMTKLRDERALRSVERRERETLRDKQRQDRERMRNRDRNK